MAWLLVMLKDLNLHGYEIMKALKENFAVVSDPGTVYRAPGNWNATDTLPVVGSQRARSGAAHLHAHRWWP
jgi:archaellum component FlaG (FlaF/FlaG flagellin family)